MDTTTTLPRASAPAAGHPGHGGRTIPGTAAPASTSRLARLWRGPAGDPQWARPALLALLLGTALLYFYNLTSSGWANSFYSAAVQAGGESWKAFFFGSSDAGNSITVDKPPASLWVMALSAAVRAQLVRHPHAGGAHGGRHRRGGPRQREAALRSRGGPAGRLVMALTPVAVLMFRFNNPEALLVLLMALGAWATMRSIEQGSAKWFTVVGVLVGLGFLTKALQVLLVVPAFGLAYLLFADTTLRRRITGALVGTAAMVLSAGWWVAIVELVPASMRPYIGGQPGQLVPLGDLRLQRPRPHQRGRDRLRRWRQRLGCHRPDPDVQLRHRRPDLVAHPSALILLAVGLFLRGRAPRTDLRRAAYVVWGGWLLVTGLTFSLMAGIFHEYYTVALAPAVAALVGMGAKEVWERRDRAVGSITLAAATAAAATWAFILLTRVDWLPWLRVAVLALGLASAFLLLAITQLGRRWVPAVVAGALVSALAGPAAYSAATVSTAHTGSIVTAGPATAGGGPGGMPGGARPAMPGAVGGPAGQAPGGQAPGGQALGGAMGGSLDASTPSTEVVSALSVNASGYRWVAAAIGSQNAAGLQLATGLPVMAIGGFNGSDPPRRSPSSRRTSPRDRSTTSRPAVGAAAVPAVRPAAARSPPGCSRTSRPWTSAARPSTT